MGITGYDGLWTCGYSEVCDKTRYVAEAFEPVPGGRAEGGVAAFRSRKAAFPATDYAPATGMLVFDIGGNKYRLIATVDFTEQLLHIRRILTHEEYSREDL